MGGGDDEKKLTRFNRLVDARIRFSLWYSVVSCLESL